MKRYVYLIFLLQFLLITSAHAYCNFEIVKMESGTLSFAPKIDFIQDIDNIPEAPLIFPIPVEEICNDNKYITFPVSYTFIDKKLYQIFIEDMISNINHLENLTYYYGKPTEEYEDEGETGMKYYHWDLSSKHVFLVIKFTPNETIQNIEIVSNKYPKLMEKYNAELEK